MWLRTRLSAGWGESHLLAPPASEWQALGLSPDSIYLEPQLVADTLIHRVGC